MYDFAVVGGGILGASTAFELGRRYPWARTLLLEKELEWAAHQSGRNSGVVHSGVYYSPGSLKARYCREGRSELERFCREQGIAYEAAGKVIVATEARELPYLAELERRGRANGLDVSRVDAGELKELEPHVAGIAALKVPCAGLVDFRRVTAALARVAAERGVELRLGVRLEAITAIRDGLALECDRGVFRASFLINCAGLHSDRVAALAGVRPSVRIVPFRGEYFELTPERRHLVRNLVYPVPDPRFPFLGVHFTRHIDGSVHAGPNAVLSLKREGYRRSDVDLRDGLEALAYAGFWRLVLRHWRATATELAGSLSKSRLTQRLQRLVPEVQASDLVPGGSGVRAQALAPDGRLVDDFLFAEGERAIHVLNAPSPAATAAIPIGRAIVDRIPAERVPARPVSMASGGTYAGRPGARQ